MLARVCTWIMELEEAGSETDYIPEHARVQFSRMAMSMEDRSKVVVQCVRRDRSLGWDETGNERLTWEELVINGG